MCHKRHEEIVRMYFIEYLVCKMPTHDQDIRHVYSVYCILYMYVYAIIWNFEYILHSTWLQPILRFQQLTRKASYIVDCRLTKNEPYKIIHCYIIVIHIRQSQSARNFEHQKLMILTCVLLISIFYIVWKFCY